jgi:LCP family protein required for cell wall assembly
MSVSRPPTAVPAAERRLRAPGPAPRRPGERPHAPVPGGRPDRRTRRAVTLLLLTLVAPGAAQNLAGEPRIGRVALRVWLGLVGFLVLTAVVWFVHRDLVLWLFTHETVLRIAAIVLFALGLAWPLLALDAWRLGEPASLRPRSRRKLAILAALIAVLTAAIPVMAGRRVWAGANLLGDVFDSGRASSAADGRYNVLLLGGDAGPDRLGTRPDSVTLASVDEDDGRTALFSLPRNLQNVRFPPGTPAAKALPNGWSCGDTCLLNAIYQWGGQHPQYFPGVKDPGAEAMKQAVQQTTGLKVNYYVLIDLQGFRSMIDAVGGIDVKVTQRVPIGGETSPISGWIEPGDRHLNGFRSLWYARSRTTTSDYDRMARQRCVMTAMVNQLDPTTLLKNFQSIAAAGKQVMSTDIPASDLPTFVGLGQKAKSHRIESVQFVPPVIVPRSPDFGVIRARVAAAIKNIQGDGGKPAATKAPVVASPAASAPAGSGAAGAGAAGSGAAAGAQATPGATATPAPGSSGEAVDVRSVCRAA